MFVFFIFAGNSSSTLPFSATSFKPEALDCRIGVSNGSPSDLTGRPVIIDAPKFDSSFQVGSAVHVSDGSLSDWKLPGNGKCCSDIDNASQSASSNIQAMLSSIITESSGVELDMPSYDEPLSASNPAETFDYLGGNWGSTLTYCQQIFHHHHHLFYNRIFNTSLILSCCLVMVIRCLIQRKKNRNLQLGILAQTA